MNVNIENAFPLMMIIIIIGDRKKERDDDDDFLSLLEFNVDVGWAGRGSERETQRQGKEVPTVVVVGVL